MAFLKKFNRQRSVDLEEEMKKRDEKEKAKEMKRAKRHSVHVMAKREIDRSVVEEAQGSKDDTFVDEKAIRKKKESERKEREKKKFKDMKGVVVSSPNEYPVFVVHYLGRMPADAEYGREAVEEPVHQLCKLREKQKLPKTLLAFNVEGMMCREVSGPFLKPKKEGLQFFIPLHHITYGVGSLTHPQVFAIITKMTDDPSPVNQVLVLHAFLCDKADDAQSLTYWQLQAYLEAFEDLKRKRLLKQRRKQAMGGPVPEGQTPIPTSPPPDGAVGGSKAVASGSNPPPHASSPSPHKTASAKTKRTNSSASTTSSSSSGSSKKTTPNAPRKKSDKTRSKSPQGTSQTGGIQTNGSIVQMPEKDDPKKLRNDAWPPRRGPPAELRGPPVDIGTIESSLPPMSRLRRGQGSADSRDSAYGEGDDEFPITFTPGGTSPPPVASSTASSAQGPVMPGIAPRRGSEADAPVKAKTFESRIEELSQLVEMDAEQLKRVMIKEYPTLSRKIYFKMTVDQDGVVVREESAEPSGEPGASGASGAASNVDHVADDSVA